MVFLQMSSISGHVRSLSFRYVDTISESGSVAVNYIDNTLRIKSKYYILCYLYWTIVFKAR